MKLALAMICKATDEEVAMLAKCLKSVKGHVDGVYINLNSTEEVPHKLYKQVQKLVASTTKDGAVFKTKWTGDFVGARQFIFNEVPEEYDWILWLDTDDTVENPEKMKEVLAIVSPSTDGVHIKYDYAHDEFGNVTLTHWVARIVRNNNSYGWKSSFSDQETTVHETLNERRKVGKVANEEFWIVHHADEARRDESLYRNIDLLEKMLEGGKANPDPRILFYLATHYVDANRLKEAQSLLETYLKLSGWAEERSQAWVFQGMIYDAYGQTEMARGCYMRALAENPNDPNPYVELGDLEVREQLFQKAVYWLEMAVEKKQELTSTVLRPMDNTYRAYKLLVDANSNIGGNKLKTASKWLGKALLLRPFDPELQRARDLLDEMLDIRKLTQTAQDVVKQLKDDEEEDKIVPFLNSLPTKIQDNPFVMSARNYYSEPVVWPNKSVAIVAGWGPLGNWGPKSLEKGIGGSEEAIIQLSYELMNLGYDVVIYGTPGEEWGTHHAQQKGGSIRWLHYWELNSKDTFDIFIGWRAPEIFDTEVQARKRYLWMHDVMDKEEFIPERLANLDKIIWVSQYHRDLYPEIPEEKCFVSGNGIDPQQFIDTDNKFQRDPHRIIYMSSHVRGLQLIYEVWPEVLEAVPDAKLDIYYGWGSYDAVNRNNPERMAWKEKMLQWEKELPGVKDHGKIGHKQIAEEIQKSGVWAYPCPFPEVYCITAVKAQAGGAIPVSSSFAALDETVQYGTKLPMKAQNEKTPVGEWDKKELDKFKDALVAMLKDPKLQEEIRPEMMKWARKEMSWAQTAKGWDAEFSS